MLTAVVTRRNASVGADAVYTALKAVMKEGETSSPHASRWWAQRLPVMVKRLRRNLQTWRYGRSRTLKIPRIPDMVDARYWHLRQAEQ